MPDAPLTILQVTFQGDGAGSTQSIFNLSAELRRRGHRVLVGCRDSSLLARLARDAGLEVVALDFSHLSPLAARLAETVRREGVDVVNSHATRDRRALAWLRWRGRLPQALVVTRRTMPRTSPVELFAIGHTVDRTIAVSETVARALRHRAHPRGRLVVVPNGIDVARIDAPIPPAESAAARAALGDVAGRPVVVIVSRRKDQDVAIRGLATVERPLLLACVGVDLDAGLSAAIATVPPRHRVVVVPFVPNPLAFYHLAAVAALPSRIEGLSQALLEAMALGLPVAVSNAGGNPDLVTSDVTGLLVPPLDALAWGRALGRLVREPAAAARLGVEGRALVRREFTLQRTAERSEAVYRAAVDRRLLLRGAGSR